MNTSRRFGVDENDRIIYTLNPLKGELRMTAMTETDYRIKKMADVIIGLDYKVPGFDLQTAIKKQFPYCTPGLVVAAIIEDFARYVDRNLGRPDHHDRFLNEVRTYYGEDIVTKIETFRRGGHEAAASIDIKTCEIWTAMDFDPAVPIPGQGDNYVRSRSSGGWIEDDYLLAAGKLGALYARIDRKVGAARPGLWLSMNRARRDGHIERTDEWRPTPRKGRFAFAYASTEKGRIAAAGEIFH